MQRQTNFATSSGGRRLKVRDEVENGRQIPVPTTSGSKELQPTASTAMEDGQEIGPAMSCVTIWPTDVETPSEAKTK